MLVKYVRNKKKKKIGVLVATGRDQVGWSLCRKTEKFDSNKGIDIAMIRTKSDEKPASSISKEYDKMVERAERYYKQ